jgi:hypothetical protein
MIARAATAISPYIGWPVVLDSNLLLLAWCASFDISLLKTFKRLQGFDAIDIRILGETLAMLGAQKTTPHVLTEVSNLANSLPSWRKMAWSNHLSARVSVIEEFWESSSHILEDRSMAILGLTDAALGRLAGTHLILSVDWPLCNQLTSKGLAALNFRHLRQSLLPL